MGFFLVSTSMGSSTCVFVWASSLADFFYCVFAGCWLRCFFVCWLANCITSPITSGNSFWVCVGELWSVYRAAKGARAGGAVIVRKYISTRVELHKPAGCMKSGDGSVVAQQWIEGRQGVCD
jgi:hypothetical protein